MLKYYFKKNNIIINISYSILKIIKKLVIYKLLYKFKTILKFYKYNYYIVLIAKLYKQLIKKLKAVNN